MQRLPEKLVGVATLLLGLLLAAGATRLKGAEAYSGVGANFLPMLVGGLLVLCGALLLGQAWRGGFRELPEPLASPAPAHWRGMAWLSAGLLINAATITHVGFIPSCTLLFVLAARGLRLSMGAGPARARDWLRDILVGAALSAPVYWLFTKLLGLSLPGLSGSGWI